MIPINRYKIRAGQGQWFAIYDNGTVVHESNLKDIKIYLKKNSMYSDSKIKNILDRSLTEFIPINIKLTNESIKLRDILFESPEFVYDDFKLKNIVTYATTPNWAFGYYHDKMYIGKVNKYHFELIPGREITREELDFAGRLWPEKKVMSFWKFPTELELRKIIKDLNKVIKENKLDIVVDTNWLIDTVSVVGAKRKLVTVSDYIKKNLSPKTTLDLKSWEDLYNAPSKRRSEHIVKLKDLITERYKFSDITINNIPNENDSMWKKIYWTYKLLVNYIKDNEPTYKKDQSIVWLIGGLKQVISGFAFQFYQKYIQDPKDKKQTYQDFLKDIKSKYEYEGDYYNGYNESILKERTPNDSTSLRDRVYTRYQDSTSDKVNAYKRKKDQGWDDKTDENGDPIEQIKIDKQDEYLEDCYNWVNSRQQLSWASKAASNPLESFNKIFEKAKTLYAEIRRKEELASKSVDFFDKISAQASPRLSLADQRAVRKDDVMSSDLYKFIFGAKSWDLSARMTLDTTMDLYVYPKVPTGGRLAQTMPETLLVNYYKRMKQNVLAMGFDQNTFMDFIEKYIGFNNLHRWFKTGKVYRLGREYSEESKRKWVPGSTDIEGIKSFVNTFGYDGGVYPKYFYSGITKYFDLYGYINYIMKELDYGEHGDSEKEILLQPNQNLDVKKLNDFNELKKEIGYPTYL